MNKTIEWIRNHQIAAFLLLTFAITWIFERLIYVAFAHQPGPLLIDSGYRYAPALAGIIVTSTINTESVYPRSKMRWLVFIVGLIVSTSIFVALHIIMYAQKHRNPASDSLIASFLVVGLIFSIQAAYVISAAWSRIPAIRNYLGSLVSLRGVGRWALLAVGIFPAISLISLLIGIALGGFQRVPPFGMYVRPSVLGATAIMFLYQIFFFECVGEEVGWRGFALPRLQARYSPLVAILIMALFWSIPVLFFGRHFPLIMIRSLPSFFIGYLAYLLPATAITVWLYNRSGGSILVAGLAHAAANSSLLHFLTYMNYMVLVIALYATASTLLIIDKAWRKLPADHPAASVKP